MDNNIEYSIVLHVIDGIRLNINNNDLILIANLNGVKFEVAGQNTETATTFNSKCIWECTFDDLKRMKLDNRPIKIECFHKLNKDNEKKSIGFILLPIRTLQLVKSAKDLQIKLHWYKLCGLANEWRHAKPEIYISAIIATKRFLETEDLDNFLEPKPIETDRSFEKPKETSLMLTSQAGIYVNLLEDECRLQVGNNPYDIDTFFVNIFLKNAQHLKKLVPSNQMFRLRYDVLGFPSELILVENADGIYNINEKISINFKSSLETLREYLKIIFYIPLDLYYHENNIAKHNLKLDHLLPTSQELVEKNHTWKIKDTIPLAPAHEIQDPSTTPFIEYVFTLNYVPAIEVIEKIDLRARGDMGDKEECLELAPNIVSSKICETGTHYSLTSRTSPTKNTRSNSSRSDTCVSYKLVPQEPIIDDYDTAYEVVNELEDWKNKQMNDFLIELKQKEIHHLNQLKIEWEKQRKEMAKNLSEKIDECIQMTESLEKTQAEIRMHKTRQLEEERAFEKMKHELDKSYTIKFMELEEKGRRLKDQTEYQQKLNDLKYKELLIEKNIKADECLKLQEHVKKLEEEVKELRERYIPREQFSGLLDDLRHQAASFAEIEKSKNFYKQQWARTSKEAHKLKMKLLKIQEEKLKEVKCFGIENILDLRNLIFEEHNALEADQNELKNIKEVLTSESELDDSNSNG